MKVFFVDKVHPILQERLLKRGFECIDACSLSLEQFKALGPEVNGVVIRARFLLNEDVLSSFSNLKFIARSGSGLENIDQKYCLKRGIALFNSPEGNRNAVAEHALGLLLAVMNKFPQAQEQIRAGHWRREENRGEELGGKTVGIVGYGNNGRAFAKLLRGFDVKVLVYDKYLSGFGDAQVQESTMEALHEQADVISLHIPQNKETINLVNEEFIHRFRKPFYLLNLSRGKIVCTQALVEALKNGNIKAAGLDVLEYESKDFESMRSHDSSEVFDYLVQSNRVILTPHVGGWTHESYFKLSAVLADKILDHCEPY
ncbi:MAG: phosphoglycerate dehydrogenase [Bacteroidetes bacterium]|nr:phosphoglycerate dehydrogenase [Bacteroidota bacterium]